MSFAASGRMRPAATAEVRSTRGRMATGWGTA